jgi:hypothetical protein
VATAFQIVNGRGAIRGWAVSDGLEALRAALRLGGTARYGKTAEPVLVIDHAPPLAVGQNPAVPPNGERLELASPDCVFPDQRQARGRRPRAFAVRAGGPSGEAQPQI